MISLLLISETGGSKLLPVNFDAGNLLSGMKEVPYPVTGGAATSEKTVSADDQLQSLKVITRLLVFLLVTACGCAYCKYYSQRKKEILMQETLDEKSICLEQVIEERDWLVKEIHHRVKNSLQIVMSLLNTQLSYLDNEEALLAIQNSQHRMFAISLIHQKLYQTGSLSKIEMDVYIPELLEYLRDALDKDEGITCKLSLTSLSLDVSRALPLGLIINEALTNALKFAFPDKQRGEIRLVLKSTDQQHYIIDISDNGIGLSNDQRQPKFSSFGQTLMEGLARQIGGSYQVCNEGGVSVHIAFNKDE